MGRGSGRFQRLRPSPRTVPDTLPVVPVTGVTIDYVDDHGDPYVFPAGVAEQEHVHHRCPQHRPERLEHPITEYRKHLPEQVRLEQLVP